MASLRIIGSGAGSRSLQGVAKRSSYSGGQAHLGASRYVGNLRYITAGASLGLPTEALIDDGDKPTSSRSCYGGRPSHDHGRALVLACQPKLPHSGGDKPTFALCATVGNL